MPQLFISHAWKDNDISRRLAADLKRDGADIWIDYARIKGGQSLPEVIGQAIEESDILILIWSKAAASSYYVHLEWNCALNLEKRIIPCVLDGAKLPPILSAFLYHDFQNYESGYQLLARGLNLKRTAEHPDTGEGKITIIKPDETAKPRFRNTPLALSSDEVKNMLSQNDFFDTFMNSSGSGIAHQYYEQTKNGDKVVIDKATDLMWQQSGSEDSMGYKDAEHSIKKLNNEKFAGYSGWRLPTLEEAMSLMEQKEKNDDLYIDPVFDKHQRRIWTCDPVKDREARAWVVLFFSGGCRYDYPIGYGIYVRAVRS